MKKWMKIILWVIIFILILIVIDLICIFTIHRPLLAVRKDYENSTNTIYRGLLYDTVYCHEYAKPQIKPKGTKISCIVSDYEQRDNVTLEDLKDVNNKIINYFSSDKVEYKNLAFNYIDEKNKVVVVGLLQNTEEQQKEFKNKVVDSNLIEFVQGTANINLPKYK